MRRKVLCMAAAGSTNQLRRNSICVGVGRTARVADQFAHRGQQATWTVQRLQNAGREWEQAIRSLRAEAVAMEPATAPTDPTADKLLSALAELRQFIKDNPKIKSK